MVTIENVAAAGALLGALVALAFAVVIWRANPKGRRNRHLALLLLAEAFFQGTIILSLWRESAYLSIVGQWISLTVLSAAFLLFSTTLEGRFARALSGRGARAALVGVCAMVLTYALAVAWPQIRSGVAPEELDGGIGLPWPLFGFASVFSLVVSLNAYASTAPDSALRRKAKAYALAFGLRDALYAGVISWWAFAELVLLSPEAAEASSVVSGITTLVFVGFLAYGILSTQLFDIDLKIKVGISRGTVASIILVAVFVGAKIVESYLNRTAGFIAGSAVAGALLFVVPKLNKVGEKVANTAMPAVQPTSDYIAFKKLEVYRAAVESALESDGRIDAPERAMLDRLRGKLGVQESDAKAVETELLSSA